MSDHPIPSRSQVMYRLSDLQRGGENRNYGDHSKTMLAGRCLLDGLEYLRMDPLWDGKFQKVTAAHAIRLVTRVLTDLDKRDLLERLKTRVLEFRRLLIESRQPEPPHYGDDYWDWAMIIEALVTADRVFPGVTPAWDTKAEIETFYRAVRNSGSGGLRGGSQEWVGPASAVAAHRLLTEFKRQLHDNSDEVLERLKRQALAPIENGEYLGRKATPSFVVWHYGQVVNAFTNDAGAEHRSEVSDLESLRHLADTDRVYALARVIEGSVAIGGKQTVGAALEMLYDCQSKRPLGSGVLAESVKASLNVLEALWPDLSAGERDAVGGMVERLVAVQRRANTIGIVVAVERERDACVAAFKEIGATAVEEDGLVRVQRKTYEAVIITGKSLVESGRATRELIESHQARWIMMSGIAGSLATREQPAAPGGVGKLHGPNYGDVVIAAATAPYRVREKVREDVQSVGVPMQGLDWDILPTDPTLFSIAHAVRDELSKQMRIYEGLIITGNGIKDALAEKKAILEKWPGALAVEEEGHIVALISVLRGRPHLIVRGISDLAEGDKAKQQEKGGARDEKRDQEEAARAAACLVVRVVERLSQGW